MRNLSIPVLAGTLSATAVLIFATPGSAFANFYTGYGYGAGTTHAAAETAAIAYLGKYNSDCAPYTLVYDTLESDGYWDAEVSARCQSPSNQ